MQVKKIGNITLTTPLTWLEYDNTPAITAEVESTITGAVTVWEQSTDVTAKEITLDNDGDGWQHTTIKDSLRALVNTESTSITTITLTDDTIINVRFRHEIGALYVEKVTRAMLVEYHECKLYLARV